ncbi:MAG: hypothetical protein Q7T01_02345 [bacterium]|nr:hypothetical protein [bacterium]
MMRSVMFGLAILLFGAHAAHANGVPRDPSSYDDALAARDWLAMDAAVFDELLERRNACSRDASYCDGPFLAVGRGMYRGTPFSWYVDRPQNGDEYGTVTLLTNLVPRDAEYLAHRSREIGEDDVLGLTTFYTQLAERSMATHKAIVRWEPRALYEMLDAFPLEPTSLRHVQRIADDINALPMFSKVKVEWFDHHLVGNIRVWLVATVSKNATTVRAVQSELNSIEATLSERAQWDFDIECGSRDIDSCTYDLAQAIVTIRETRVSGM